MPPSQGGGTARAVLSRTIVYIPDIREDHEYRLEALAQAADYLSVLAVPMLLESRPIGVVVVTGAEAGAFSQRQIELLQPGLCVVEETGDEMPGSPLMAVATKSPFDKVVCVEADAVAFEALQQRVAAHERGSTTRLLLGKCNELSLVMATSASAAPAARA